MAWTQKPGGSLCIPFLVLRAHLRGISGLPPAGHAAVPFQEEMRIHVPRARLQDRRPTSFEKALSAMSADQDDTVMIVQPCTHKVLGTGRGPGMAAPSSGLESLPAMVQPACPVLGRDRDPCQRQTSHGHPGSSAGRDLAGPGQCAHLSFSVGWGSSSSSSTGSNLPPIGLPVRGPSPFSSEGWNPAPISFANWKSRGAKGLPCMARALHTGTSCSPLAATNSHMHPFCRSFAAAAAAEADPSARLKADLAIIGGGIVGLATAREFLLRHPTATVSLVEKERELVAHQTSHNSGVIHAGIYYEPGSTMARLCVQGAKMMYDYCQEKGIKHERVGKLIVATREKELPWLDNLFRRASVNGVEGLEMLGPDQITKLEPNVRALRALHSPNTGIVDYADVGRQLARDAKSTRRAELRTGFRVEAINADGPPDAPITVHGANGEVVKARFLITCAGLQSDRVARLAGGAPRPSVLPFRGTYHEVKPEFRHIVKRNIYPVPDPRFSMVGVHLTPKIDGRLLIGPNAAIALSREGYNFFDINILDIAEYATNIGLWKLVLSNFGIVSKEVLRDVSARLFVNEARRYCPTLTVEHTQHGFSGVHAVAIENSGMVIGDFVFEKGPHNRVLHVRNAPSPACTASLAIGKDVVDRATSDFNWNNHTFARKA